MFRKQEVCCISDIHIGVHQNTAMWHDITLNWAKWLKSELESKDIQDIVICGDLFHYRDEVAVNTLQIASDIFNLWKDFNITIIVGNHDAYYKDKSDINSLCMLKGWENVTVYDTPVVVDCYSRRLMFCPWGTNLSDIKKSDIIFGHFEIETFKLNEFKLCTNGIKSKDLLQLGDLVVTGHFHLKEERVYDDGIILYIGNPFQMDFGDVNGTKGYYILDIPTLKYDFYENTISPKHKKVYLSELVTIGSINDTVKNIISNNIIKFIIDKNISPDEVEIVLRKLLNLNPVSINVDYAINFDKFGINYDDDYDLSGIDMIQAIEEFINLLDVETNHKAQALKHTLRLYKDHR
jgi:DNA repair exonuclease SbcCD nuclease subunit